MVQKVSLITNKDYEILATTTKEVATITITHG